MWAVIFILIFSLEKSSALQGVVTVKCLPFVLCGNCLVFFFCPWLALATCEQFETSAVFNKPMYYILEKRHFC